MWVCKWVFVCGIWYNLFRVCGMQKGVCVVFRIIYLGYGVCRWVFVVYYLHTYYLVHAFTYHIHIIWHVIFIWYNFFGVWKWVFACRIRYNLFGYEVCKWVFGIIYLAFIGHKAAPAQIALFVSREIRNSRNQRNLLEILLNQTEIRLYLPCSD